MAESRAAPAQWSQEGPSNSAQAGGRHDVGAWRSLGVRAAHRGPVLGALPPAAGTFPCSRAREPLTTLRHSPRHPPSRPLPPSPARDAAPGFAVDDDACQGDHNCQEHQNHHHDDREAPGCCGTHGPTSGQDLRQGPGRFPETQPFSAPIGRALWTPQGGPSTLHRDSQLSSDGLESLAGWPWATVLWAQLCL